MVAITAAPKREPQNHLRRPESKLSHPGGRRATRIHGTQPGRVAGPTVGGGRPVPNALPCISCVTALWASYGLRPEKAGQISSLGPHPFPPQLTGSSCAALGRLPHAALLDSEENA